MVWRGTVPQKMTFSGTLESESTMEALWFVWEVGERGRLDLVLIRDTLEEAEIELEMMRQLYPDSEYIISEERIPDEEPCR